MKKAILPIAAIAALTAIAVAFSAISAPVSNQVAPVVVSQEITPTLAPASDDCCDKPAQAVIADADCNDCDTVMAKEDCGDCEKHTAPKSEVVSL